MGCRYLTIILEVLNDFRELQYRVASFDIVVF